MNSLTELKNIIHSLNHKITPDQINLFQKKVSQLGLQYKSNSAVASFLNMMKSLGTYLNSKKDTAHKDSIPVLNSIVSQLENIISNPKLKKEEIHQLLSWEIQNYTGLKNKIASKPVIHDTDINGLKAVILSIDWEISDTTLLNFEKVVTQLMAKLKNYKIHHSFLKIIYSTGQYIGSQKANAHKDSVSFLRSVFENFEHISYASDMSFTDKKEILQSDIIRFHTFKTKISRKKTPLNISADYPEEETIQPALSHIKKTVHPVSDTIAPLTALPEQEYSVLTSDDPDLETLEPALSNRMRGNSAPRDIMEDLFNVKESPADELLDAIHLQNIQGQNQSHDQNLMNATRESQSRGIKNFTPKLMDNEPIAEIGDRLDAFFNLETVSDPLERAEEPYEPAVGEMEIQEPTREYHTPTDGIVPFQYEDESFDESPQGINGDNPSAKDPALDILSRLQSGIKTSDWVKSESALLSMQKDLFALKNLWQSDPEKTCLIEMLMATIDPLKTNLIPKENDILGDMAIQPLSSLPKEKPIGVWKKIKKIFTSSHHNK